MKKTLCQQMKEERNAEIRRRGLQLVKDKAKKKFKTHPYRVLAVEFGLGQRQVRRIIEGGE